MHTEILSILGKTFEFKSDSISLAHEGFTLYKWRAGEKCLASGLSVDPDFGGSLDNPMILLTPESDNTNIFEVLYTDLPATLSAV